jgi:glycosyltransferase involved in cell wall biosynthesis
MQMPSNPLISVITINYNDANGLEHTVASVHKQSYKPIEYIVIDGGSTDGSRSYLENNSELITHWVSEPDTGIYNAMNKGIAKATGMYVLFLNSGDTFYSETALASFIPYVASQKDIYYGNIQVLGGKVRIQTYPEEVSFAYFVKKTLPHPAALIKRSCLETLPFDETLQIVSDWKFFTQGICKHGFTYQYVNAVISSFRMDGISSTNPNLVKEERLKVLETDFSGLFSEYQQTQKLKREQQNRKKKSKFEQLIKKIYRKFVS